MIRNQEIAELLRKLSDRVPASETYIHQQVGRALVQLDVNAELVAAEFRKPVGASGGESGYSLTVVCDDGAVFYSQSGGRTGSWTEERPIPGTRRARERGL